VEICHIGISRQAFSSMAHAQPILEAKVNEVPLSIQNIEDALLAFAIPGMYGSVRIRLKLLPTAAHEVMLAVEHRTVTRLDVTKSEQHIIASNERYNRVRQCLAEKAQEFRVVCPISEVIGHFQDGKMSSVEIVRENQRLV
jgi:hypothetical protein